jgi:CRP-like cAMP-binding protein
MAELLKDFYLLRSHMGDDVSAPTLLRTVMEAIAERRQYASGEIIFRQGEIADALYLVAAGTVDILAADADASEGETHITTLGVGEEFGEMAFLDLDHGPRSATARAGTPCHLIRVPYASLREELRKRPQAAALLYRNAAAFLVQRLRRTTAELSIERDKNLHRL